MIKVLLLGATGKLGQRVLDELLKGNRFLVGLLIRNLYERNLPDDERTLKFNGDITIKASLENSIQWADVVINCSGYVSYKRGDRRKLRLLNVDGVKNITEVCLKYNKRLLHTSSTAIYGCTKFPELLKENSINERHYNTEYGLTKFESEQIILSSNVNSLILRPSSLISKGKSSINLLYTIYKKGYITGFKGGGSFTDLDEVAKVYIPAIELLLQNNGREQLIYNLGGHNLSCAEVFDMLKQLVPHNTKYIGIAPLRTYCAINDFILSPIFNYSLITTEIYYMANHFNYIDSSKAIKTFNYNLKPFKESLNQIIQPC